MERKPGFYYNICSNVLFNPVLEFIEVKIYVKNIALCVFIIHGYFFLFENAGKSKT